MSELEEWQGNAPASEEKSEKGGDREGFRPSSYNRDSHFGSRPQYSRGDRPQRPRFNRNERAA